VRAAEYHTAAADHRFRTDDGARMHNRRTRCQSLLAQPRHESPTRAWIGHAHDERGSTA
jgi:hypothetical protein